MLFGVAKSCCLHLPFSHLLSDSANSASHVSLRWFPSCPSSCWCIIFLLNHGRVPQQVSLPWTVEGSPTCTLTRCYLKPSAPSHCLWCKFQTPEQGTQALRPSSLGAPCCPTSPASFSAHRSPLSELVIEQHGFWERNESSWSGGRTENPKLLVTVQSGEPWLRLKVLIAVSCPDLCLGHTALSFEDF